MPSEYTGVATNAHSPSALPSLTNPVEIQVPVDVTDPFNASTFNQPPEVLADWVAFLRTTMAAYRGITLWDAGVSYTTPCFVVDPSNGHLYKANGDSTNLQPSTHTSDWLRVDYDEDDIKMLAVDLNDSTSGIVCSHGASVPRCHVLTFNTSSFRQIMFNVNNVPWDSDTDIDLNGSGTKFATGAYYGVCSLASGNGGYIWLYTTYGGDMNVCHLGGAKTSSDPATTFSASVILFGA